MQTVYLKDGRMADLVTKTDKGYLVDPYITWTDYDGQEESAPSGSVELVPEIYNTAPVELIEAEYKKVLERVEEQEKVWEERQKELQKINHELGILRSQKTDAAKVIFNRQELTTAKRLIVWIKGEIPPRIMDKTNPLKLTISYSISQYRVEEKCWAYGAWSENSSEERWSTYSEHFDEKYGIKVDLTDEEILEITHKRQMEYEFESWLIERTNEKWLTPENVIKRNEAIEKSNEHALKNAEQELINIQAKIDKLKNSLTVS